MPLIVWRDQLHAKLGPYRSRGVLVKRACVAQQRIALAKPYALSIGTLEAFDSIIVAIERADGAMGIGEAVPLPGYGWETTEGVWSTVNKLTAGIAGTEAETLAERCRAEWRAAPFAASAVMTALEIPDWLHYAEGRVRFPVNAAIAPTPNPDDFVHAAELALAQGYKYLKLKIGLDVVSDITAMRVLLDGLPGRDFRVVADANQAYTIGPGGKIRACSCRYESCAPSLVGTAP